MAPPEASESDSSAVLTQILNSIKALQVDQTQLSTAVEAINGRVNVLSSLGQLNQGVTSSATENVVAPKAPLPTTGSGSNVASPEIRPMSSSSDVRDDEKAAAISEGRRNSVGPTSRIILTTYPNQSGIDPLPMDWGANEPAKRGPVVVSRGSRTFRRRNGK